VAGMPTIRVAAALVRNDRGQALLVRKRGTVMFMNPGGKYEPGETAAQTLVRELEEELGLVVTESDLAYLGFFETDAANEPGHALEAEVFAVSIAASVEAVIVAQAEIAELRWVDPVSPGDLPLAPLARDHILPLA
jgi:8-oxo-dGTP diphosphatase